MYKRLCLFAMLLLGAATVSAQQEIYFNDTNLDKKEIKVNKTVQGVQFSTDFIPMLGNMERNFKINAHYFHEDRIASTLTLHNFVGVQNNIAQDRFIYNEHGGFGSSDYPMNTYYNLNLQFGTELRWYFSHYHRHFRNKKMLNNTGWFLAIPLTYTAQVLNQPNGYIKHWISDQFYSDLNIAIKIGYRYAFNKHWMIEGAFCYSPVSLDINWYGCGFSLHTHPIDMFRLELKAVYVFK